MKKRSYNTKIYHDYFLSKGYFFIRLCPVETKKFPHGLPLKHACSDEAHAARYQGLVDDYLEAALPALMQNYIGTHGVAAFDLLVKEALLGAESYKRLTEAVCTED